MNTSDSNNFQIYKIGVVREGSTKYIWWFSSVYHLALSDKLIFLIACPIQGIFTLINNENLDIPDKNNQINLVQPTHTK